MSILEPLEITDTHVVVNVPHLSAFGLVWDFVMRFANITRTINGQVLLFLRPPDTHDRILDVFLLQDNIPLSEVKLSVIQYVLTISLNSCFKPQLFPQQAEQSATPHSSIPVIKPYQAVVRIIQNNNNDLNWKSSDCSFSFLIFFWVISGVHYCLSQCHSWYQHQLVWILNSGLD